MKAPDQIKNVKEMIINFKTKSLRDTINILSEVSLKEAASFIEENSHPRLWRLLSESALEKLDFGMAEKAFVKCEDYHGINFVKRLQMIDDDLKKRAEIYTYFGKYEEAENIYGEIDRKDLSLELREKLGDYPKVIQLLEQGAGSDEELKHAYNNMGAYFADRKKWKKAANYFTMAQNNEALIEAYYRSEDYDNLKKLVTLIPEDSQLLEILAQKFQSVFNSNQIMHYLIPL
jgi:WD repeat-containing protein 35